MNKHIQSFCVDPRSTIRETIACIDSNARAIALVLDKDFRLTATITDGDIRRAILSGLQLDEPVGKLLETTEQVNRRKPITAPKGTPTPDLLILMQEFRLRQVPLLDAAGLVVDMAFLEDLLPGQVSGIQALIMAGGFGQRLRPLTEDTPKPMLPVGDRPLLAIILEQLRCSGIRTTRISTHYKPEQISNYFGDGAGFGLDIQYVHEDEPLGTAGAVGRLQDWTKPLLVMNGDILTRLDFRSMLMFHQEHSAALTMAVRKYDTQVPYGVVEANGCSVIRVLEKPKSSCFINAGVYLLSPDVRRYLPKSTRFDMTDLIEALIANGREVVSFPIHEYWLDIGQPADYQKAQADLKKGFANVATA